MKQNFLDKVKSFYNSHKRLPSYSEMLTLFGFSSKNSVYKLVQKWLEDGFLKKEGSKLAPTHKFFALPFLGLIKAGYPILAEENKNYLSLDEYLIGDPQSSFLLKVSGDSMVEAGIFDGDIVVIEKKRDAITGDIVLAEIDREWTLKVLRRDKGGQTYLEAANPNYPFFYPKRELKIFGIVKAVVRKYN
jgi:repressor LexA